MAHFAEINENNIVLRVIVVSDNDCGENYPESDAIGAAFCTNLLGGTWKQTSYNHNFRKNYAGIGYTYDEELDAFIEPRPFPSWTLNTQTGKWEPPIAIPEYTGLMPSWDEESQSWN